MTTIRTSQPRSHRFPIRLLFWDGRPSPSLEARALALAAHVHAVDPFARLSVWVESARRPAGAEARNVLVRLSVERYVDGYTPTQVVQTEATGRTSEAAFDDADETLRHALDVNRTLAGKTRWPNSKRHADSAPASGGPRKRRVPTNDVPRAAPTHL